MPWKDYDPKTTMPQAYVELSEWGVVIPTSDSVAWEHNHVYRWIYNKLQLCESQELACGPVGTTPTEYPIIIKPAYNMYGGGAGAFVCHDRASYNKITTPGMFWSTFQLGEHYSIDLFLNHGLVQNTVVCFRGEKLQLGMFDYWELVDIPDSTYLKLKAWAETHLAGYTGCLNLEVINDVIIEAHLRFGDIDRLGDTELLESIHCLYNASSWTYNKTIDKKIYIAALFAQPGVQFSINETLAKEIFAHLPYYFFDKEGPEKMGMPLKGQRIALFCGHTLEEACRARNIAIALFKPHIHGMYTDALTNFVDLRI